MFERERTLAYFTEEEIINYCGGRHEKSWRGEGRGGNDVNSAFMQEILKRRRKMKENMLLEGAESSTQQFPGWCKRH